MQNERAPALRSGTILDRRYEIRDLLKVGGMGAVYRARQINLGHRGVAVKVLNDEMSSEAARDRFEREARVIACLRHPNTVRIYDAGVIGTDGVYLVMELLEGQPLAEVMRRSPLSQRAVLRIARQIAGSLMEAHALGIVHRDLKPANILVERIGSEDVVKVLDFGLAKVLGNDTLSVPGQLCGTLGFMSPEQLFGEAVDARTDIFALGALLYEALAGRPPFQAKTVLEYAETLAVEEPEPIAEIAGVHPALARLIHTMLAKEADHRPSSMYEVGAALEAIARELDAGADVPCPLPRPEPLPLPPLPPPSRAEELFWAELEPTIPSAPPPDMVWEPEVLAAAPPARPRARKPRRYRAGQSLGDRARGGVFSFDAWDLVLSAGVIVTLGYLITSMSS